MKISKLLTAVVACLVLGQAGPALARVRSNTQVRLPNNLYLAEMTGDGVSDFVAIKDAKIMVARTNFEAHGVLYAKAYTHIKRVFTGYFWDRSKEQICTLETDGYMDCYGTSPDNTTLWWGLTQQSFVADDEHALVGDYNGDGYDDILVYKPVTGEFRMYTRLSSGYFGLMPNFVLGNISNPNDFKNMRILVGEFSQGATTRRDDLLVYNPATGQIGRYEAAVDSSGRATFWWAFWTGTLVAGNEEVTVANIDGDNTDDVALHSTTGGYRFFKMDFGTGYLVPINQPPDQLATYGNANLFWGRFKGSPNEPGLNRDDGLVSYAGYFIRSDARWSGSAYTYWWTYTQQALNVDADQDGDSIKTLHELGGYDPNNDGVSDTPLHRYGASPFGKDIFVEVDYMAADTGESQSHIMKPEAVNLAVQEMARFGINLHIFVDEQIPHIANLGNPSLDWVRDFDPIKNARFSPARAPFFHYCVFGHAYGGGSSSGISRGIPASDFLVTLGGWGSNPGTVGEQAGTFLHELGHNLGLKHGGNDHTHYKPNFLSVMGYLWQTTGIVKNGTRQFLYSELLTNTLDENNLNEWDGVRANTGGNTFRTYVRGMGTWHDLNTAIDYNGNGVFNTGSVRDLNGDGSLGVLTGSPNEYNTMVLNGGSVGSAGLTAPRVESDPEAERILEDELTYERYVREVLPLERKMPPLDLRPLSKPVREHQPLFRTPEWLDLK